MRNDVDCEGMYEMFLASLGSFILKPCVKNYETYFFFKLRIFFSAVLQYSVSSFT